MQRGAQPPYLGFQLGDLFTLVLDREIACHQLCPVQALTGVAVLCKLHPSRRRSASTRATRRAPEARVRDADAPARLLQPGSPRGSASQVTRILEVNRLAGDAREVVETARELLITGPR